MMVDLSNSNVNEFLQHVVEKSKSNSSIPGDRLNAYYIPDFCKNILRICKLFPLWSNVMRQISIHHIVQPHQLQLRAILLSSKTIF